MNNRPSLLKKLRNSLPMETEKQTIDRLWYHICKISQSDEIEEISSLILRFLNAFHELDFYIQSWSDEELEEICDVAKRFYMAKTGLREKNLYEDLLLLACKKVDQWEKIVSLSNALPENIFSIDPSDCSCLTEKELTLLQSLLKLSPKDQIIKKGIYLIEENTWILLKRNLFPEKGKHHNKYPKKWLTAMNEIGHGSFGKVYEVGSSYKLSRNANLFPKKITTHPKVIKTQKTSDSPCSFRREMEILINLGRVARPSHTIQTKNELLLYAFSMHKAPGKPLSQLRKSSPTWDSLTMLFFLNESLKELSLIHERGYCHNDIAGRNVMYDLESRKVTIIDMGFARKSRDALVCGRGVSLARQRKAYNAAISSDLKKLATLWLTVFMALDESGANIVTDIWDYLEEHYSKLLPAYLEEKMPMWYKSLNSKDQKNIHHVLTICLYNLPEKIEKTREKALQTLESLLENNMDEKAETNFSFKV